MNRIKLLSVNRVNVWYWKYCRMNQFNATNLLNSRRNRWTESGVDVLQFLLFLWSIDYSPDISLVSVVLYRYRYRYICERVWVESRLCARVNLQRLWASSARAHGWWWWEGPKGRAHRSSAVVSTTNFMTLWYILWYYLYVQYFIKNRENELEN